MLPPRGLCPQARVCSNSFTISLLPGLVLLILVSTLESAENIYHHWQWINLFNFLLINLVVLLKYHSNVALYGIIWRSCLLGSAFGSSFAALILSHTLWRPLFLFLMVLSLFHFSEYFFTAVSRPRSLETGLFLLNHSPEYHFALVLAITEYLIEALWLPHLKYRTFISIIGLGVCTTGEILRKGAMLTARSNFNHKIKNYKDEDHVLVTHGIYAWSRHPAYVGWFYWAIGTQIILLNPISLIFYTVSSWKFFADRVYCEEILLLRFFGEDYKRYQEKVPTRLPFIEGYFPEAKDEDLQ